MPKWIGNRFGDAVPIAPGTSAGSAVYSLFDQYYASEIGGWASSAGLTASGGSTQEYNSGSDRYKVHIFTSNSTFQITDVGNLGASVNVLVVAGGGGGGWSHGGGGGAGGFRTNTFTAVTGDITVQVGGGSGG